MVSAMYPYSPISGRGDFDATSSLLKNLSVFQD